MSTFISSDNSDDIPSLLRYLCTSVTPLACAPIISYHESRQDLDPTHKIEGDARSVVTKADVEAEQAMKAALMRDRPEIIVIGEESEVRRREEKRREEKGRVICFTPHAARYNAQERFPRKGFPAKNKIIKFILH